jgi:diphthamide biosynthesis methyltransferase
MFYAIGLGLADEKDVSVKGLEIIKRAERVYLEAYTAVLLVEKEVLVRNSFSRIAKHSLIAIAVGSLLWP